MNTQNYKQKAYVGTYTKGESKGIYSFTLDSTSGKIEQIKLAYKLENPTYLAIDKNNTHLYSVIKEEISGGVAAFSIDQTTDNLKLLNYEITEGTSSCHVILDKKNNYLFSSDYHSGTIEVYPINKDGSLSPACSKIIHEGAGPNSERQTMPHVHSSILTPDEKYLFVMDLGTDKLVVYTFDDGILSKSSELALKPGSGPRHMAFHPNGSFAYILTELSSEVLVLGYSEADCSLKELQYISLLPAGYKGENLGSAIHMSPSGDYLYASNRGHNSIAVFSVDKSSGLLKLVSHTSTFGDHPRDFSIDPTGRFLIVANLYTNNLVTFSINATTGNLTPTNFEVSLPSPVCIKFLL